VLNTGVAGGTLAIATIGRDRENLEAAAGGHRLDVAARRRPLGYRSKLRTWRSFNGIRGIQTRPFKEDPMTVTARTVGDITILDVQGTVTVGEQAERLRDKVRSVAQEGARRILVNMAGISYVDSAGLGELIAAYTTTKRQGGTLKLLNTTKRLTDLLVITKLATVFETFDDEAEAIASFGAPV
jgi:anti-sigma B factor antagonist